MKPVKKKIDGSGKVRAWGGGRLQEQVFRINLFKYELLLFRDITPPKTLLEESEAGNE